MILLPLSSAFAADVPDPKISTNILAGYPGTTRYKTTFDPDGYYGSGQKVWEGTDGNPKTFIQLGNAPQTIRWDLPENKKVVGYKFIGDTNQYFYGKKLLFYDDKKTNLANINLPKGDSDYHKLSQPLTNVRYVAVNMDNIYQYASGAIYELEIWVDERDTIPPDTPKGLKTQSLSKQIRFSWDKNIEPDLDGYFIFIDGKKFNDVPYRSNSIDLDFEPLEKHSFSVSAIDVYENESPRSASVEGMAYPELIKPVLMVAPDVNEVYLSWKSEYKPYEIYMGGMQVGTSSNGTFKVSNLRTNTSYEFFIRAKDPYGRTVQSDTVSVVTKQPPAPVPPKINVLNIKHNAMTVVWEGSPYASKFRLLMDGNTFKDDIKGKSLLVDKLTPKQSYKFQVEEQDVFGRTVMSDEITATTIDLPPAYLPKLQATNITEDSVRLLWNSVGKTYKLYQDSNLIRETSSLFYVVNGLSEETEYKFKLVAVDEFDRENESNEVVVLTLKKPPEKPPPKPRPDPPPVSDSGNKDLDKGNDHIVEGGNDLKKSAMELIMVIILIIILIFGILWLLKIFKKKMAKSAPRSSLSNGSSGTKSMGNVKKPPSANGGRGSPRAPMLKNRGTNISNFTPKSNPKGKKYHVEKTRYTRERSYKKR